MGPDRVPVTYIGGMGRSGSTVLADLAAGAAGAVSVGEVRYLWTRGLGDNQLCSCGAPFRECAFWTDVLREAFGGDLPEWAAKAEYASRAVDRMRYVPALCAPALRNGEFRAAHRQWCDVSQRLYGAIHDVSGGAAIIDSSKDPSYVFALRSVSQLRVNLVHLVRDSRAVAYSWTRHKLRPEIHWQQQYMNRMSPLRSAKSWLRCNLLLEVFRLRYGNVLRLRYEDFTADPEAAVARVAAVATARAAPAADGAVPGGLRHSISGNPVRFERGPLRIVADNAWQQELPRGVCYSVTAMTSPLLAAYDYPLSLGAAS